ncbi:SIS domain-containing protein [Candidatus Pelagibacter ubique]|jgi:D-sedoheptulose 7-phosphate isomerase|nr:SIS domain-containing protein [Candidatus Pelagibacter ubique]
MNKKENNFFLELNHSINSLQYKKLNDLVLEIQKISKKKGRIFFLGVGGSAGNASHAVNDFRKICNIECYAPTDNVSELTARTNDEGFNTIFSEYLKCSKLTKKDAIFIFSVGGGNLKLKVSVNLIEAIKYANKQKAKIFSIVGKNNGYAYKNSNVSIYINVKNKKYITPVSEAMQGVIWHYLVSDKRLQKNKTKW